MVVLDGVLMPSVRYLVVSSLRQAIASKIYLEQHLHYVLDRERQSLSLFYCLKRSLCLRYLVCSVQLVQWLVWPVWQ